MTTKILDCTLRDGGYYNRWFFKDDLVKNYLNLMNHLNIDYVEIGFRKKDLEKKFGDYFSISDDKISKLTKIKKFKISVMIDLSDFEKDCKIRELFKKKNLTSIDLVRIACNYEDLNLLNKVIIELDSLGYKIAVNLMKATAYTPHEIWNFYNKIKSKNIEYFYIADSYGNCTPKFIEKVNRKFSNKKININKLGFHAHDNIKLAKKNALKAKKLEFGIIDTSVLGMGRGAGNLKLEEYINFSKKDLVKKKKLQNFIKTKFTKLKREFGWGSNKFYIFAAKNFIHPTYVQRLIEDKKFNSNQVMSILHFLKKKKASKYDLNIFDKFFYKKNIKKNGILDFPKKKIIKVYLNSSVKIKKLLSVKSDNHYCALLNFSKYVSEKNLDFLFLCNPFRLATESRFLKNYKNYLIVPNKAIIENKLDNKKIIPYDIFFSKKLEIKKNFCSFNLNLVLVYALAFFISKKFLRIKLYGLSNNDFNNNIISKIKFFIKQNRLKTKITQHNV